MNAKKLTSFLMAGFIVGVNIFSMPVYATNYTPGDLNTDTEINSSRSFSIPITITKQAAETQNIGDPHGMSDTDDPNIPNIGKVFIYGDISTEPFNFKAELKTVTFTTGDGASTVLTKADAIADGAPLEVNTLDATTYVYFDPINYYFGSSISSLMSAFASDNSVTPDTIVNGNPWHTDTNGNLYLPLDTTIKVPVGSVNMSYMEYLENHIVGSGIVTAKFDYDIYEKIDSSRTDIMYTSATMPLSITFDLRSSTTTDSSGNIIDSGATITTEYAESYFKNVNLGGIENNSNLVFETGSDGTNTSSKVITVGTDTDGNPTFTPSTITGDPIPTAKGADGTTDVPSIAVADAQGFSKVIADSSANETITKLLENANIADYNNTFKFKVYWQNSNDFNTGSRVELGEITNNNDVIHGFELVNSEMRTAFVNALKSGTMYKDFNIVIAEYVDTATQFDNASATDPKFVFDESKEVGATLRLYLDSNGIVHTDMLSTVETNKPGYFYHNLKNSATTVFGAERDSSYANYLDPSVISFTNKYVPSYSGDIPFEVGSDPDDTDPEEKKDDDNNPLVTQDSTAGEGIAKTLLRADVTDDSHKESFGFNVYWQKDNTYSSAADKRILLGTIRNSGGNIHSDDIKVSVDMYKEFQRYTINPSTGTNTFNILITEQPVTSAMSKTYMNNISHKAIGCTLRLYNDASGKLHVDTYDYFIHDTEKDADYAFGAERTLTYSAATGYATEAEFNAYYHPTPFGFTNVYIGDISDATNKKIEIGTDPSDNGVRIVENDKDPSNPSNTSEPTETDPHGNKTITTDEPGKYIIFESSANENVNKTLTGANIANYKFKFNTGVDGVAGESILNTNGKLHSFVSIPSAKLNDILSNITVVGDTITLNYTGTGIILESTDLPTGEQASKYTDIQYNPKNNAVAYRYRLYLDDNLILHADTTDYHIQNQNIAGNTGYAVSDAEFNPTYSGVFATTFATEAEFNEYYHPSTGVGFINKYVGVPDVIYVEIGSDPDPGDKDDDRIVKPDDSGNPTDSKTTAKDDDNKPTVPDTEDKNKTTVVGSTDGEAITKQLMNGTITKDMFKNAFEFNVDWVEDANLNSKTGGNGIGTVKNEGANIHKFIALSSEMKALYVKYLKGEAGGKNTFRILLTENSSATSSYDFNTEDIAILATLTLTQDKNGATHSDMSDYKTIKGYTTINKANPDASKITAGITPFKNKYNVDLGDASKVIIEVGSDPTDKDEKKVTVDSEGNITNIGDPDTTDDHGNPTVSNPDTFTGVITGKTVNENVTKVLQNGNINGSSFRFDINWVNNDYTNKTNGYIGSFENTNGELHKYVAITQDMLTEFQTYVNSLGTSGTNTFNILITEQNSGLVNGIEYNIGNKAVGCSLVLSLDDNYVIHTDIKDYFIHDTTKTGLTFGSERTETSDYYKPSTGVGFINKTIITPDDIVIEIGSDPTDDDDDRVVTKDDGTNNYTVEKTTEKDSDNKPTVPTGKDKQKTTVVGSTDGEVITKVLTEGDISKDKFKNSFDFKIDWIDDTKLTSQTSDTGIGTVTNDGSNIHTYISLPTAMKELYAKHLKGQTGGKNEFRILITEINKGSSSFNYNTEDIAIIATLTLSQDKSGATHSDIHDYKTVKGYSTINKNNPDSSKIVSGITPFKNKYIRNFDASDVLIEIGSDPTNTNEKKITVDSNGNITNISNPDTTDSLGNPTVSNPDTFKGVITGKTANENVTKVLQNGNISGSTFRFDVNWVDNNFNVKTGGNIGSLTNDGGALHKYISITQDMMIEFQNYVNSSGANGTNTFNILITEQKSGLIDGIDYNIGTKAVGCSLVLSLDDNDVIHTDIKDYFIHDMSKTSLTFGVERTETSSYYKPTTGIGFINKVIEIPSDIVIEVGSDPDNNGDDRIAKKDDDTNDYEVKKTTEKDSDNTPTVPSGEDKKKTTVVGATNGEVLSKVLASGDISKDKFKNAFEFKIDWIDDSKLTSKTSDLGIGTVINDGSNVHTYLSLPDSMKEAYIKYLNGQTGGKNEFRILITEVDKGSSSFNYNVDDIAIVATLTLSQDKNNATHSDVHDYKTVTGFSTINKNNPDASKITNGITPFKNKYLRHYNASDIVVEIGSDDTNKTEKKVTTDNSGNIVSVTTPDTVDTHGTPTVSNPDTFRGTVTGKTVDENIIKTLLRANINNYTFDFNAKLVDNNYNDIGNGNLGSFTNENKSIHKYLHVTTEMAQDFTQYVNTDGAQGKNQFNVLITEKKSGRVDGFEYNVGNKAIACTLKLWLDDNDVVHTDMVDYFIHDMTKNTTFGSEKSETSKYYKPAEGLGFINICYTDLDNTNKLIAEVGYDKDNPSAKVVTPNPNKPSESTISNTSTKDKNNIPSIPSDEAAGKIIFDASSANENVTKTFLHGDITKSTFGFTVSRVDNSYNKLETLGTVTNTKGVIHEYIKLSDSMFEDLKNAITYTSDGFSGSVVYNLNIEENKSTSSSGVKYNVGDKNVSYYLKLYVDTNGVIHVDSYNYYIHNGKSNYTFGKEWGNSYTNSGDYGFTSADKFKDYYYPKTGLGFINSKNSYVVKPFGDITLGNAGLKSGKVGSKASNIADNSVRYTEIHLSRLNAMVAETLDFAKLEMSTDADGNDYVLEYGVDGVTLGIRRLLSTRKGGVRRYGTGDSSAYTVYVQLLGIVGILMLIIAVTVRYLTKKQGKTKKDKE